MRRTLLRTLGLVGALALLPPAASAQQARMYGTVTDESGRPVEGATVSLEPVEGRGLPVSGVTKGKGDYIFGLVRPGEYELSVQVEGKVVRSVKQAVRDVENRLEVEPKEEPIQAGNRFRIEVKDGQRIQLDIVVGSAVQVATAEGGTAAMSPEEALNVLSLKAQEGKCPEVLEDLEAAVAASPQLAKAHYVLGYCQAVQGQFDKADQSLARVLELNQAFPGAHLLRGQVLRSLGKNEEAENELKAQVSASDDVQLQTNAWISLGMLYRDTDRPTDAVDAFTKVTELAPERSEAYVELSLLHAKLGQPDKAAEVLEKARAIGVTEPAALLNVGIGYFNRKDYARAATTFRQVIELGGGNDDLAMAHALLGKCQMREGRQAEAIASFQKSLELDPDGPLAAETREILKALGK